MEDPAERVEEAIGIVQEWRKDDQNANDYLNEITNINTIICANDLPEFYDPIDFEKFKDHVDSYNFNSIYKYFKKINKVPERPEILLICWLARILSLKLLSETIYILLQKHFDGKVSD